MSRPEGLLVAVNVIEVLKRRFERLDDTRKALIREIADQAHGDISLNPPTERRVGIARILLEVAENDATIDNDLIRSICELRTSKKYKNAGLALADLSWSDAERVWSSFQDIYANRVELEYIPVSNHYITKEICNVR